MCAKAGVTLAGSIGASSVSSASLSALLVSVVDGAFGVLALLLLLVELPLLPAELPVLLVGVAPVLKADEPPPPPPPHADKMAALTAVKTMVLSLVWMFDIRFPVWLFV